MADDLDLDVARRKAEIQRAETLLGGLLEVLEDALVAGVVGNHELEIRMRRDQLVLLLQRQHAARIG